MLDTLIGFYDKEVILENFTVNKLEENIEKFRIDFSNFLSKNEDLNYLIFTKIIKADLNKYNKEKAKFYNN